MWLNLWKKFYTKILFLAINFTSSGGSGGIVNFLKHTQQSNSQQKIYFVNFISTGTSLMVFFNPMENNTLFRGMEGRRAE